MFPPMRLVDGDVVHDIKHLMTPELKAMERALNAAGAAEIMQKLEALNTEAVEVLVWVARKRQQPTLALADVVDKVDFSSLRLDLLDERGHIMRFVRDQRTGQPRLRTCLECARIDAQAQQDAAPDPTAAVTETAPSSDAAASPSPTDSATTSI